MIIALDLRAEGVGSSTSPTTVLCVLPSQGLSLSRSLNVCWKTVWTILLNVKDSPLLKTCALILSTYTLSTYTP